MTPTEQLTSLIPSRNPREAQTIWTALTRFGYSEQDLVAGKIRTGLIMEIWQTIKDKK